MNHAGSALDAHHAPLLMDMGLLIVLAAVYSFITWRRLVGKSPGRR